MNLAKQLWERLRAAKEEDCRSDAAVMAGELQGWEREGVLLTDDELRELLEQHSTFAKCATIDQRNVG